MLYYTKFNKRYCNVNVFKTIFIIPIVIKNILCLIKFSIYFILLLVTSSFITPTEGQSQMTAVIILSIVVGLLLIICLILVVIATITVYKYKKDKREVPNIQVDDANETTDNRVSVYIEDNSCNVVIKKSALINLDKFNTAIMEVLIQISKHEETNNNIQQRIQRLIHQLSVPVRPPPPTRAVHSNDPIRVVCDSRSRPVNIYDLPESPRPAPKTKSVVYYDVPQPTAKVEITQYLGSQANPMYDTIGNEPNEQLTTLLKSELPGTHVKFMELLELKTNSN